MSRLDRDVVGERIWVTRATGRPRVVHGAHLLLPGALDGADRVQVGAQRPDTDAEPQPRRRALTSSARCRRDLPGTLTFMKAMGTSGFVVVVSTLCVLILAVPAAYALAIRPIPKWRDVLLFFISTKFLPIAAAILPLYTVFKEIGILDTRLVLVIVYTSMNLPLAVWMLRSFFAEVPRELLEAAEIDGASFIKRVRSVLIPIVMPGLSATALLCFIFAWNEFFLAVNLTTFKAQTMPIWVTTMISTRGQFLAKLSAAATLACLPVIIAGWAAQKRLVRGLTMGAVK